MFLEGLVVLKCHYQILQEVEQSRGMFDVHIVASHRSHQVDASRGRKFKKATQRAFESRNSKWYVNPRFLSRVSRPHTNHTKVATGYSFLRDYSEQLKMCICICISRKPLLGRSSRQGNFGYKIDSI